MNFDLTDARIVLVTHRSGTLAQAAAETNLVPTAVSMRIKRLEERFAVRLFERTGRGLRPTLAGDIFAARCEEVLRNARATENAMAEFIRGERGVIRIHSNTYLMADHLPRALGPFLAAHPEVEIALSDRPSRESVRELLDGRVHMAIVTNEADLRNLDAVIVRHERLVVLCPADDPVTGTAAEGLHFDSLLDCPLIGMPEDSAFTRMMHRQANELGRDLGLRLRLPSFEAVATAVAAGGGFALMPDTTAERCLTPGLAIRPLAEPWAERDLLLATRNRDQLPAYARALFDHLCSHLT